MTLPLERSFQPFVELPEHQQAALRGVLLAVLFDDELLAVLEQVVRPAVCRGAVSPPGLSGQVMGWPLEDKALSWDKTVFKISPPPL